MSLAEDSRWTHIAAMRFLKWFIIGLLGFVLAVMMGGFFAPTEARVERSTVIHAPVGEVMRAITDFEVWQEWEPWGRSDPSAQIEFGAERRGVGASYAWRGEKIGQGRMEILHIDQAGRVDYELTFGGNADERALASFMLKPEGTSGTHVTWTFETNLGSNPVNRLVGLLVDGMLGRYYEEGLDNLAEIVERQRTVDEPVLNDPGR